MREFRIILCVNRDYFLNNINQLIFIMVKCVFFEVRTEFLNIIYTRFGFKELIWIAVFWIAV
jgi:hypothetical protein